MPTKEVALAERLAGSLGPFNFVTNEERDMVVQALRSSSAGSRGDAPWPKEEIEPGRWVDVDPEVIAREIPPCAGGGEPVGYISPRQIAVMQQGYNGIIKPTRELDKEIAVYAHPQPAPETATQTELRGFIYVLQPIASGDLARSLLAQFDIRKKVTALSTKAKEAE